MSNRSEISNEADIYSTGRVRLHWFSKFELNSDCGVLSFQLEKFGDLRTTFVIIMCGQIARFS